MSDLLQFFQRLDRAGGTEVRLYGNDVKMSFFGSTLTPTHLADPTPLVIVHRGIMLGEALTAQVDVLTPTRSLLDRMARLNDAPYALNIPPVNLTAVWAGVLPPRTNWEQAGTIDALSLTRVAREGADRVASLLPEQPGQPLVDEVRSRVWSLPIAQDLPAGAAFALDAMGFLREQHSVQLYRHRTWARLSTRLGDVFVRQSAGVL